MTNLSDDELKAIKRGGFDHKKLYAAFDSATKSSGKPTVILVKTLKGYGLGEGSEGRNIAHKRLCRMMRELKLPKGLIYLFQMRIVLQQSFMSQIKTQVK